MGKAPRRGVHWRFGGKHIVAALLLLGACSTDSGIEPAASSTVSLPLDVGTEAVVPSSWAYFSDSQDHSAVFAASPSEEVLDDHQDADGRYGRIGESDLDPEDTYVEVWVLYPPSLVEGRDVDPLPKDIDERLFVTNGSILGEPVFELKGMGENDGLYAIRYWLGPEADADSIDQTHEVLASLEVGQQLKG
jgi:hypothetical protein